jgi:hydrogenase expression/formation protein HypD
MTVNAVSMSHNESHIKLFRELAQKLQRIAIRPVKLMEVCGTHTMAIGKAGIRSILPPQVELVSGPGCPVCVTDDSDIDAFMDLAQKEDDIIITTYGDMMRVPGSNGSLSDIKAQGADIRVVYSATEALAFAKAEPGKKVVFLGVGFETTVPATAHAVKVAHQNGIDNFMVFNMHKTVPEALKVLLSDSLTNIDGFLLPGHVSVILGEKPYRFIAEEYGVSGAIAGFEPPEIMVGIVKLVQDFNEKTPQISNLYRQVVKPEGNTAAQSIIAEVFEPSDAKWRGIGMIPGSGLKLRDKYLKFDVERQLEVTRRDIKLHKGCSCGMILKGAMKPSECALFAKRCTPDNPVGPCMVSSEGTCAAYYLYSGAV